jgi:hypothetical protein
MAAALLRSRCSPTSSSRTPAPTPASGGAACPLLPARPLGPAPAPRRAPIAAARSPLPAMAAAASIARVSVSERMNELKAQKR